MMRRRDIAKVAAGPINTEDEVINFDQLIYRLSARARHVLASLEVHDLNSFLSLTRDRLIHTRSCGKKTTNEIENLQRLLREARNHAISVNRRQMSLFIDVPSPVFEALKAVLSVRARHVLETLDVTNFKEFMLLEEGLLFECPNCGRKTVQEIRELQVAIEDYARELTKSPEGFVPEKLISAPCLIGAAISQQNEYEEKSYLADIDTPAVWLRDWVHTLARSEQQEHAFLLRKGMLGLRPMTLEMVAKQVGGVTRERVRQMEKTLEERAALPHQQRRLRPLISTAVKIVQQSGGLINIEELTVALLCRGKDADKMRFAFRLLEFIATLTEWKSAGLHLDKDGVVTHTDCRSSVSKLVQAFHRTVLEVADEWYSNQLWSVSREKLKSTLVSWIQRHPFDSRPVTTLSDATLDAVLKALSSYVKSHRGRVYSAELWALRFGNIVQMVEKVLLQMDGPAHFSDIAREVRKWRPHITNNCTHAALDRSKHVLLWDRGTFIHRDNVNVPLNLIHDVEAWLFNVLDVEVPFVSVYGAFLQFRSLCKKAGIPSDVALYSCLRQAAHPGLVYPRLPYVYRREGFTGRVPMASALEMFLRDAGGPVSREEFRNYAVNRLFLREHQFFQLSQRITNVIRTHDWGYIHIDNYDFDESFLRTVVSYTRQVLAQEGHCSVDKIYRDKRVTCLSANIDGPVMLYSILQLFAADALSLPGYPYIARQSDKDGRDKQTIRKSVINFVRDACEPCTYEALEERFVKQLGYKEQLIYSVIREPDVCRYHPGCVVHLDCLRWNKTKQAQLELQAAKVYTEARKAGRFFARLSYLLEVDALPDIPTGLHWSRTLIADLLTRGQQFVVFGNMREAYLPRDNDLGIHTLQDLVALLLEVEWGGGANRIAFETFLAESGIIKKQLTQTMLRPGNKVVIKNGEIILKRLLVNA